MFPLPQLFCNFSIITQSRYFILSAKLANAFHELNDPEIQRARSNEDLDKKKLMGKEVFGLDESFFTALDQGMPPSSGIALGVERLYMALRNIKNIDQVK